MVVCAQCGVAFSADEAGRRMKQRPRKCAACRKVARKAYDEARAQTAKGTYDRLCRTLKRHGINLLPYVTMAWVERTLQRWGNTCVISGQTLGTQLDLVPYRGFPSRMRRGGIHAALLPHQDEWLVVTTANKVALGRASLGINQRMARWPEHVHTSMQAAAAAAVQAAAE